MGQPGITSGALDRSVTFAGTPEGSASGYQADSGSTVPYEAGQILGRRTERQGFRHAQSDAQQRRVLWPARFRHQARQPYGRVTVRTVTSWLNLDTPPVAHVRSMLMGGQVDPGNLPPPLLVKLWIGRDGTITRMELPPLSDQQVNQGLQGLLIGRHLSPPPPDMLQPLRIAIQLHVKKRSAGKSKG